MIYGLSLQLLGRHITNGTHHHARVGVDAPRRYLRLRLGISSSSQLRQAEVQYLDSLVSDDKKILRLQITMDNSLLMSCRQSVRDLPSVVYGFTRRQNAAGEALAQRLALKQF